MSKRLSNTGRVVGVIVGALVVAALGFVLAVVLLIPGFIYGTSATESSGGYGYDDAEKYSAVDQRASVAMEELALEPSEAPMASDGAETASVDTMVIRNANMEVRVEDVEPAIEDVRTATKRNGGEITSLSVHAGSDGVRPLQESIDAGYSLSPAAAYITIRVPAENLEQLEQDVAKTGTVLSQSASADDVTEEYIDLSARLKNLKAEEARLRTFFDEADDVKDLLAVQSELARVRGEIEAMQSQIDYLDRQVAKATLTVTLTEPGPIVRPGEADWGFTDAITRGIQAAAALINWFIVAAIALLPLALVAVLIWLVVRALTKRRRSRLESASLEQESEGGRLDSQLSSSDDEG
jgi:hypothetical protein